VLVVAPACVSLSLPAASRLLLVVLSSVSSLVASLANSQLASQPASVSACANVSGRAVRQTASKWGHQPRGLFYRPILPCQNGQFPLFPSPEGGKHRRHLQRDWMWVIDSIMQSIIAYEWPTPLCNSMLGPEAQSQAISGAIDKGNIHAFLICCLISAKRGWIEWIYSQAGVAEEQADVKLCSERFSSLTSSSKTLYLCPCHQEATLDESRINFQKWPWSLRRCFAPTLAAATANSRACACLCRR